MSSGKVPLTFVDFVKGIDAYTYPPLPRVPLSYQASACILSTLHFLKFLENSFEVLKLLENSEEVLKIMENKLESMKILG
nr:hypothetical protein [Tanacetum cinerariifolium]